jgi:hypothetical protein
VFDMFKGLDDLPALDIALGIRVTRGGRADRFFDLPAHIAATKRAAAASAVLTPAHASTSPAVAAAPSTVTSA